MRIGCMCAAAVWLAGAGTAYAEAPRATYAAISGVVLNDATGAPVRRAVLTLSTLDETPLEAVTFSESNGTFGFIAIPPGKYHLSASVDGFQPASFGASSATRAPGTLTLSAGDLRYGITFRLRPLGSISGLVLDPEGDPLPNVQMRLMKAVWSRLKPAYQSRAYANTDDRGRYHFSDLVPGQYIVMAAQPYGPPQLIQPDAAVGQAASQKIYAAQFYPDAARLSLATPVEVGGGKDLDSIDFHLSPRAVAPLHGRLLPPAGVSISDSDMIMISVYPQDVPGSGDQSFQGAARAPNFEFEIDNLVAGSYAIQAIMSIDGRTYHATERMELPPGGQEISLQLTRAIDLAGRVDLEGAGQSSGPISVSLVPGGYPPGRGAVNAETQPDGTFIVRNLVPGIWDIDAEPVPAGGYIKSMRLGDQDVLTDDMTIDSSTREPLNIVLSSRGAVVSGTVIVPHGVARTARSRVLLAPAGKYANVLSFYQEASADESGHVEFKGVTPGTYRLYAFEELELAAYNDPAFLKPWQPSSEAFEVGEGQRVERQTQLILAGTQAVERE